MLQEEYGYDLTDSPYGLCYSESNELKEISGKVFSYNNEDQLLTAGGVTYNYDLDGFLETKVDSEDITGFDYSSRSEL